MEKADFLQKPVELAQSSQHFIESLWKIGTEVSKFYAPITSIFSSIFSILFNAIIQELNFNKVIHDLTLTRFTFLPPYDLRMGKVTQQEEEYLPMEIGRPNISFLFNVAIVRKLVSDLARRLVKQTPEPTLFPTVAPLSEPEITEEVMEKPVEEVPEKTMFHFVADLQSALESKLTPSMESMVSVLREYGRQAIPLTLFSAMPKPVLLSLAGFETLTPYRVVAPPEKEPTEVRQAERLQPTEVSPVPPPYKETMVEPSPLDLTVGIRYSQEALRSFGYAIELPTIVSEQEAPFLKMTTALSWISSWVSPAMATVFREPWRPTIPLVLSPAMPSPPSIEPSYHYSTLMPQMPTPMPPSQINILLKEISPSLTSWIYGESEILRGTRVSLSAVPVAASTAEKIVTETLTQPISGLEASQTYSGQEPVSQGLTPIGLKAGARHDGVEAFRLPSILTSLVASYIRAYPLLFAEPTVSEIYEAPFEVRHAYAEQPTPTPTPPSTVQEEERFSRLPAVIALAAAESLIAQRLRHEMTAFAKEIQVARLTYGETLAELGSTGLVRTTMLGELATRPVFPSVIEPYTPSVPSASPPQFRPSPISPTIQNTINLTVSAESAEEDLRDLERKISRILAEQLSRYYGSSRI